MSRHDDRRALIGLLKLVMVVSLAGMGVMWVIAWATGALDGLVAQILLTFVALVFGSLLMQVQLRPRRRMARGLSPLQVLGLTVIAVSQASFLTLVWTEWRTHGFWWRLWWISMVPSVVVTHLILIRSARRAGAGRAVEHVATVCILWVGLMVLWLGVRPEKMFAGISPVYLWVGSVPAAGTVICSLILAVRQFVRVGPRRPGSKRGLVAGMLMSHLVLAVAGYYIGRANPSDDPAAIARDAVGVLREQVSKDRYTLQSKLAEYLGDTRIITRDPLISVEQIEIIQEHLRPGDIVLERRNWYLSNSALPGFWPHAAMYLGSVGDLEALGVLNHPAVQKHLVELCLVSDDNTQRIVIEAVSEGVVLMAATHSLHADYVAVLRPRLSKTQIAQAVIRAFEHKGKPYDFDFDFDDTDKLVCTQLIYEAYKGMIDLETVRVMGRNTLPAGEIAKAFASRRTDENRSLDLVVFLDGVPADGTARRATEEEFVKSISRPRALVEN